MLPASAQLCMLTWERMERRRWEDRREAARGVTRRSWCVARRDACPGSGKTAPERNSEVIPIAWWSTVRETASGARRGTQPYRGGATCREEGRDRSW